MPVSVTKLYSVAKTKLEDTTMASKENFSSMDSLKPIIKVVNEAGEALKDTTRTIDDSPISEVLAGAVGAGAGGALSFVALVNLGMAGLSAAGITSALATAGAIVGGGMVAGIFVLAAPIAILSAGAVGIAAAAKRRKLIEKKEELLRAAVAKYDAIVRAIKNEVNATKDRAEYLNSLNILLRAAIRDLKADLGKAA
jgi:mannose/fructose/N-acetylgalactosamine-specific phosphotransferase system component IID